MPFHSMTGDFHQSYTFAKSYRGVNPSYHIPVQDWHIVQHLQRTRAVRQNRKSDMIQSHSDNHRGHPGGSLFHIQAIENKFPVLFCRYFIAV